LGHWFGGKIGITSGPGRRENPERGERHPKGKKYERVRFIFAVGRSRKRGRLCKYGWEGLSPWDICWGEAEASSYWRLPGDPKTFSYERKRIITESLRNGGGKKRPLTC